MSPLGATVGLLYPGCEAVLRAHGRYWNQVAGAIAWPILRGLQIIERATVKAEAERATSGGSKGAKGVGSAMHAALADEIEGWEQDGQPKEAE